MSLWTFIGASAQVETTTTGNFSLTEPAGVQAGDLLVAVMGYRGNAAITPPALWNNADTETSGNTTANATTSIASGRMDYIVRGGSAPALTWNRTSTEVLRGQILAFRPPAGVTPTFDQASGNTLGAASLTVTATGITTPDDGELLVMGMFGARNVTASAPQAATDPVAAGWTIPAGANTGTATGNDMGLAAAYAVKEFAGATGNFQWTASQSARHATIAAGFRIQNTRALKPTDIAITPGSIGEPGVQRSFVQAWVETGNDGNDVVATGISIGAPAADRLVMFSLIALSAVGTLELLGASIGGIECTIDERFSFAPTGNPAEGVYNFVWFGAFVPSGSTAEIRIHYDGDPEALGGNQERGAIYRVTGSDGTVCDMQGNFDTTQDGDLSLNIDVNDQGVILAATQGEAYGGSPFTTTWIGVNEDYDSPFSGAFVESFASQTLFTGETGRTVRSNDDNPGAGLIGFKGLWAISLNAVAEEDEAVETFQAIIIH